MAEVQKLAQFVADASWEAIEAGSREQLKIRVLDSLACAIGAQEQGRLKTRPASKGQP